MQTSFTLAQLSDPNVAASEQILRKCVHCGFCTATCPTYVLRGDERDSPRGRIYLIKQMLESGKDADAQTVLHVDRCLSCLSCMTTCPSGVNYMHLVDHARAHIDKTFKRPVMDRLVRSLLALVLPRPGLFRLALTFAPLGRIFSFMLPGKIAGMLKLAPKRLPPASANDKPQTIAALGQKRYRVALMTGCAQKVLNTAINDATIRLLARHGCEVVIAEGAGCCGALVHHMGREHDALTAARGNIDAWTRELDSGGLDAIIINASGCGTTVKDYGFMLRTDPAYAEKAARISALTRDITEWMDAIGLSPLAGSSEPLKVAYHSACSLQHGQKITAPPKALLRQAGFDVRDIPEAHLCCGSAGTYNILQPVYAEELKQRKIANIAKVAPDVIAAGNIGCMVQIGSGAKVPVVHTVELLDWATGGPKPAAL